MPAEDSPAILVARFLRSNNYTETLEAFLNEAGLPPDAGSGSSRVLTIEQVLDEKRAYDLSVNFEKLGVDEQATAWTDPAPAVAKLLRLPASTNLLCLSIEKVLLPGDAAEAQQVLLASTADRRLHMLVAKEGGFEVMDSVLDTQDSPILSFVVIRERWIICSCMSGRLAVYDSTSGALVAERKDHQKYVVQVATFDAGTGSLLLATAGWDGQILLYNISISLGGGFDISEPLARIPQSTNPEALLFVRDPDDHRLFLIATRRDSSFLHYYHIPEATPPSTELSALGRQNLAPHSNAWVAFTPSAIALHPRDSTLIAVATSAVPHMKLLIVRLLFPSPDASTEMTYITPPRAAATSLLEASDTPINQQARAALALQDREAAAILIHANTMASQTQYSSPQLVWRPDGSGVWVNSDDGVVRGVEATTGKVIANLVQGGHEVGSKIRCLYAGFVEDGDGGDVEVLLSGGFDQRLVHWEILS